MWEQIVKASREDSKKVGQLLEPSAVETVDTLPVPDPSALSLLPEEAARKHGVVPVSLSGDELLVACSEPKEGLKNLVSMLTGKRVRLLRATAAAVSAALDSGYSRVAAMPDKSQDAWASQALEALIRGAVRARASDIHVEPEEGGAYARYRIDGVLHDAGRVEDPSSLIGRIKVLSGMSVVDRLIPQDGQMSWVSPEGRRVDLRVSVIPTVKGEKAVLRVLDRERGLLSLDSIGFEPDALSSWRSAASSPHGMAVVAGPTGSGKTTLLYATLSEIDRSKVNVCTLEDPVEYVFERTAQVQVNPKAGLTFPAGLRALLRQDPDVIVVGEIRDPETASIAAQAALTGHLVLASLHATDAVSSVFRLLDMGVERYVLAAVLNAVSSQRLIRLCCKECSRMRPPAEAEASFFESCSIRPPDFVLEARGCSACAGTGYSGRTAAVEVVPFDASLKRLVASGASPEELESEARKRSRSLKAAAALKALRGETTVSEVLRAVAGAL